MKKIILTLTLSAFLGLNSVFALNTNTEPKNGTELTKDKKDKKNTTEAKKVYYWEVECNYGVAKGYSTTIEKAKKMIALMSENDVYELKLITNGDVKK